MTMKNFLKIIFIYLLFSTAQAETIEILEVLKNSTIRSGPSADYKATTWVKKGATLIKTGYKGGWSKVELHNGKKGWISKSLTKTALTYYSNEERPIAKNCWKADAGQVVGKWGGSALGAGIGAYACAVGGTLTGGAVWAGCAAVAGVAGLIGGYGGSKAGESIGGWFCN